MFQTIDQRSPEAKAAMEREWDARLRKTKRDRAALAKLPDKFQGWQPIETMPFRLLAENYGLEATVLVSDGTRTAVVTVKERFGRPIKQVEAPVYVMTDEGMCLTGGKYEEYDHPKWWFDWEFTDALGDENELYGKPEIDFVATHWTPLPLAPTLTREGRDA